MPLTLSSQFEADVAALAGITQYDAGSLNIQFLNPTGDTTARFTVAINVNTPALKALITKYAS
jgi:hypothetical protein